MAIQTVTNPIDDSEMTMAVGIVQQISFKEIENDRFGNTHRAGIRVDDDWVNNVSLKVKEGRLPEIRFNAGNRNNPDWQTLEVGDSVKIVVNPSTYNNKTYYNSGVSKIKLVKKGEGQPQQQQSSGGQKKSFGGGDKPGISVGHALNGAMIFYKDNPPSEEDLVKVAHKVHDVTVEVKKWYKENNPKMNEYDVGAASGNAVLNALKLGVALDELEQKAKDFLVNVVPQVMSYVVGETKPVKKEPVKQAPAMDNGVPPVSEDWDDSIPFIGVNKQLSMVM